MVGNESVPDDEDVAGEPRRRSRGRRLLVASVSWLVALVIAVVAMLGGAWFVLDRAGGGDLPDARTANHDALWMGHMWVDGRRDQADVDQLATLLRQTGVHDLYVHAGPLSDDGTLDPSLRPRAKWLLTSLHTALPGVRVQAWLGDVVGDGRLDLGSTASRKNVVDAVSSVLAEGWDGVHLDLEPIANGNDDLPVLLHDVHAVTKARKKVLSVAAAHLEPFPGIADTVAAGPREAGLWSPTYLGKVAAEVDQVALMSYDSGVRGEQAYAGYVRRTTEKARKWVPADVDLIVGLPAYHDDTFLHTGSETVGAALRGVRLAVGEKTPERFGVGLYVDFDATADDWDAYRSLWGR